MKLIRFHNGLRPYLFTANGVVYRVVLRLPFGYAVLRPWLVY